MSPRFRADVDLSKFFCLWKSAIFHSIWFGSWWKILKCYLMCTALVLTKIVIVFWLNLWQNVLIWQGTTCAIRTNGKNFNPFGCRNIRIGCFKGLGQSNNPIFCWYVSKHIWRCKIMRWKSRYRCCVDNSSSSASLDSKKWKNAIFAQKRMVKKKGTLKMSSTYLPIMAIRVVDFSNVGYKIRKVFA